MQCDHFKSETDQIHKSDKTFQDVYFVQKTQIILKRTVVFRRLILPQTNRQIEIFLRLPFHTTHTYRIACILLHVRAHNKH